jgi:hypothetical protein
MIYGWLDTIGQITADYHAKDDKYLALLKDKTIGIPTARTFRFAGYRTSIIRFLQENAEYKFLSDGPQLYMRCGEEMDSPGKAVAQLVGGKVGGTIMPDIPTIVTTGVDWVSKAVNAGSDKVKTPGKIASGLDKMLNKRVIVDLNSLTRPAQNQFDLLHTMPQTVTFPELAGWIQRGL